VTGECLKLHQISPSKKREIASKIILFITAFISGLPPLAWSRNSMCLQHPIGRG
jgi:hypothetical protein